MTLCPARGDRTGATLVLGFDLGGTAMTDQDRIGGLEAQIEELKSQLSDVRRRLVTAEFDQWRGRIDDLELQAKLGSMGVQDRVMPVVEQLRDLWLDARERTGDGAETASEVAGRLREGVESAYRELRNAVSDAASTAKG
jgi:molecular chaperone GrpE (heat shock protein)